MSYIRLGAWVEGCTPGFHAKQASVSGNITGDDTFDPITYTNGSLTETTKTLPAFLSLSLLT